MREGNPPRDRRSPSIEQGYPIRTAHQKRSRSRVLTASLLWHKQHTMPEPAFALFFFFFFTVSSLPLPCTVALRDSRLGKTSLPTLLHQSLSAKIARHYTPTNTTLLLRLLSLSLTLAQLLFPFLSLPLARSQLRRRKTVSFQHILFLLLFLSTISYVISVKFN